MTNPPSRPHIAPIRLNWKQGLCACVLSCSMSMSVYAAYGDEFIQIQSLTPTTSTQEAWVKVDQKNADTVGNGSFFSMTSIAPTAIHSKSIIGGASKGKVKEADAVKSTIDAPIPINPKSLSQSIAPKEPKSVRITDNMDVKPVVKKAVQIAHTPIAIPAQYRIGANTTSKSSNKAQNAANARNSISINALDNTLSQTSNARITQKIANLNTNKSNRGNSPAVISANTNTYMGGFAANATGSNALLRPTNQIRSITADISSKNAASDVWNTLSDLSSSAASLIKNSMHLIGIPYKYGGNTPSTGLDCSGFVRYVYQNTFGFLLPRRAVEMSRVGRNISATQDLKAGDLVFFNTRNSPYSHVGIYIGGNRFIHAPSTGAYIRIDQLSNRYWSARYMGGRRIIGFNVTANNA